MNLKAEVEIEVERGRDNDIALQGGMGEVGLGTLPPIFSMSFLLFKCHKVKVLN